MSRDGVSVLITHHFECCGHFLAVAFHRIHAPTKHQQRQFGELEQRHHHAERRRHEEDGDCESTDREQILSAEESVESDVRQVANPDDFEDFLSRANGSEFESS